MALKDMGFIAFDEPFKKFRAHGLITKEGAKMSKSKGNVVNPDEVVKNVGADSLRVYEMFMGPFEQEIAWSTDNMVGSRRFLDKVWKLKDKISTAPNPSLSKEGRKLFHLPPSDEGGLREVDNRFETLLHKTIKKVTEDILNFNFNTAISAFMILVNLAEKEGISKNDYEVILKLLAPFAPHITEELWANLGHKKSIHLESWPKYDEKKIISKKILIVVQINGKVRGSFDMPAGSIQEEVEKVALAQKDISKWLLGKEIKKKMFLKGRILSLLVD